MELSVGLIGLYARGGSFTEDQWVRAILDAYKKDASIAGYPAVLLSTCNRTEIYFSAPNISLAQQKIVDTFHIGPTHYYSYTHEECFIHLCRVVSGLDSLIVGECEIQRQVKEAYVTTSQTHKIPSHLHFIFQKALHIGKVTRSAGFSRSGLQVLSRAIWTRLQREGAVQEKSPLLFVGNSKTNRAIIADFAHKKVEMHLCTKHPPNDLPCQYVAWDTLKSWSTYSVIICASRANEYLIEPTEVQVPRTLIFDFGLPRNVHPSLENAPRVTLYRMEHLIRNPLLLYRNYEGQVKEHALRLLSLKWPATASLC